jgi:hypothetical protein
MGDRGAETRRPPVVPSSVDNPFMGADCTHRALKPRHKERSGIVGLPVGEPRERSLRGGEQHGDLLALALQGTPRSEDLLGQMRGSIVER